MAGGPRSPRSLRRLMAVAGVLALAMVPACDPGPGRGPDNAPLSVPASLAPPPIATPGAPTRSAPADGGSPALADAPHLQRITGLGVNANVHSWRGGELKPAIDQIAQLGQLTWRVIIDRADWEPTRHGDAGTFDWTYYEKIYRSGKMADLFDTIEYIESIPGQQVSVNVMGGVPDWMGGTRIDPTQEDYWVRMIASMAYYGKVVRKLNFTLLSPLNEPDVNGIEGPLVDSVQYVRLMEKLSVQLDKLGLNDIMFVGPDTGSPDKAVHDYWPAIAASGTLMARFAHFGIHTYDGTTAGAAEALAANPSAPSDVWVTEFSGPCPGCDTGAPNPGRWDTAQDSASLAIWLLHHGMSGLQFYDAWDGFYEHHNSVGYWGLLAYDAATRTYSPRKSYFVMRQLFEFVPAGSALIDCSSSVEAVQLACFSDPATGRLTVFGSHDGGDAASVKITLPHVHRSGDVAVYRTDATSEMVRVPNVRLTDGSISVVVGAHSVFTLTTRPSS
ncbi:hypothetical protein [Specibacter sp. RAF43]|uniref:hypothetical protein n=1 Tax=Specibacter sp. RAF43 TaxID=3233057 RepID=UPI003F95FCE1